MDKNQPAKRAIKSDFAEHDDNWIEHDLIRNKRAKDQDGEERISAFEFPVGQCVAIHGRDDDRQDHGWYSDLNRVPESCAQPVAGQASDHALTQG